MEKHKHLLGQFQMQILYEVVSTLKKKNKFIGQSNHLDKMLKQQKKIK